MAYELTILLQGYPGKSVHHGGLGWSTSRYCAVGSTTCCLTPDSTCTVTFWRSGLRMLVWNIGDITAVAITHSHWDHCVNFAMFPKAEIFIGETELEVGGAAADREVSDCGVSRREDC